MPDRPTKPSPDIDRRRLDRHEVERRFRISVSPSALRHALAKVG